MFNIINVIDDVINRDLLTQYFEEAGWELRRHNSSELRDMWFGKGDLITFNFRHCLVYGLAMHVRNEMEAFRVSPHNLNMLKGVGGVEKMIVDWAKEVELEYKLTRL